MMQLGMLHRTPKGRIVTDKAYIHLGLPVPEYVGGAVLPDDSDGEQLSFTAKRDADGNPAGSGRGQGK